MRLAVYSDYAYRRRGTETWAEEAVVLFHLGLRSWVSELTLIGRLDPVEDRWAYRVPDDVALVALPHYPSLARPQRVLAALVRSSVAFWRSLASVDAVWLLGPHPFALLFAVLALLRGRRVTLGVRQDLPAYVANRHPGSRPLRAAALALEGAWRLLGRLTSVIVVGPDLGRRYRRARRLLEISISLVSERSIAGPEVLAERDYGDRVELLSVGRLDAEKNPLLLVDVLARLREGGGPDFHLTVVGAGALRPALERRIAELELGDAIDLIGYLPLDEGLLERYRSSDLLLHCSWTEGMPQVLLEAFAARLPIVATAVGGVPDAATGAAELIPPGDAVAAANAVRRLAADGALRERLTAEGARRARTSSLEATTRAVVEFIDGSGGRAR